MKRGLYALYDNVAQNILGDMVHLLPSDPPAVRFFGDVASAPNTPVAQHVEDYSLICIADVDTESATIIGEPATHRVVITGAQWKAAQDRNQDGR